MSSARENEPSVFFPGWIPGNTESGLRVPLELKWPLGMGKINTVELISHF